VPNVTNAILKFAFVVVTFSLVGCGQKASETKQVTADLYAEPLNETEVRDDELNMFGSAGAGASNASMAIGSEYNYDSSPPDNDVVAIPSPPPPKPKKPRP
jgi:hypothetical protein